MRAAGVGVDLGDINTYAEYSTGAKTTVFATTRWRISGKLAMLGKQKASGRTFL